MVRTGLEVFTYFAESHWRSGNPQGVRGRVGAYHRTLSTYLNTLVETGFAIEQISEPQASEAEAAQVPGYRVIPAFMLVRCIKPRVC